MDVQSMNNKPKEPILAVLLNCAFLGLGHFYAGAKKMGGLLISACLGILLLFLGWAMHPTAGLSFLSRIADYEGFILFILFLLNTIIFILILIDGYKCAKRFNAQNNLKREITRGKKFLLILGIVAIVCGLNLSLPFTLSIRTFIIQAFKIPSGAMRPTLQEGDRLFTYKFAYMNSRPERGDIAVFTYPQDPSRDFIKRVIAKGGETVEIKNGSIYINDQLIESEPSKDIYYYNQGEYGQEGQKITVPEGHYFVLGDNSASSRDSRYWGFVPEENFIGKAYKIYYPFERSGPIK